MTLRRGSTLTDGLRLEGIDQPGADLRQRGYICLCRHRRRLRLLSHWIVLVIALQWACVTLSTGGAAGEPAVAESSADPSAASAEKSAAAQETQASWYDPVILEPDPDLALDKPSRRNADAIARFLHGLILEDEGQLDAAIDAFTRVLDIDPSQWELASRLSAVLVRRGESPTAIDILRNTAEARPDDHRPLIQLANIYTRTLNKPELALGYAEKALKVAPNSFDPYATLHEIYTVMENPARAEAALTKAGNSASTDPRFWLRLATMRMTLDLDEDDPGGDPERLNSINALFKKAVELGPEDLAVLASTADYYVVTRQLANAVPLYRRAIALQPAADLRQELLHKLAGALATERRYAEAVEALEDLLRLNPLQPDVHQQLGVLYKEMGDAPKAADAFERSVAIDPTDPDAFLRAASLLMEIKEYDRAATLLEQAYEQFPAQRIDFGIDFAFALSRAERHAEALTIAERVLELAETRRPELLTFALYYVVAGFAYQAEDVQRAAELYRSAIKTDPDNAAAAYNDLGYMWVERELNLDEAGELIRRALELEPDNGAYIDSLGWYYYKKGVYDKALVQLLKAAEHVPEDATEDGKNEFLSVIYDHIGDAYEKLDNTAEALLYWKRAIAAKPDLEGVQAKIEKHSGVPSAQAAANPNTARAVTPQPTLQPATPSQQDLPSTPSPADN